LHFFVGEKQGLLLVFLRGPREFVVQERGKSLVSLWWIVALTWCMTACFLALKNTPTF
jgi:hypothetical protein